MDPYQALIEHVFFAWCDGRIEAEEYNALVEAIQRVEDLEHDE